jgi:sortase, srtB family
MRKKLIAISVLACSLLAMLFSFFNIVNWIEDNKKTKERIEIVQEVTKIEINPVSTFLSVDFTELSKINDEVVAWIKVPETSVNYPVVKHKDNSYYLTHSYDKSFNYAGWIYTDYRNDIDDLVSNNIIYGHGRVDGSMFGSLRDLINKDGSEKLVYISTPYNNYIFQVFSIYRIMNTNDYLYTGYDNNEKFLSFIDLIKNRSLVKYDDLEIEPSDKILTLATCYDTREKFVIHAKMIKWEKRF